MFSEKDMPNTFLKRRCRDQGSAILSDSYQCYFFRGFGEYKGTLNVYVYILIKNNRCLQHRLWVCNYVFVYW